MHKKLYRRPKEGIVLGIASGIAHYFDKDPVLIRLILVALAFITEGWPILVAYFILFVVVPVDPAQEKVDSRQEPKDVTSSEGDHMAAREKGESGEEKNENQESPEPQERMDSGLNM